MKTVAEIAKEIGVSKQAVWKRIKGSLSTNLQQYMSNVDGTVYIQVDGVNLLKQAFNKSTVNKDSPTDTPTIDDKLTVMLMDTIEILRDQLAIKDKQIDDLSSRLAEAHQMASQAQQLHGAEKVLQIDDGKSKKRCLNHQFVYL